MTLNVLQPTMPIAVAVQQLRRSPQLPHYVQEFLSLLHAERERRERFYEEMNESQKTEFINGEIIMHSPARLRHTTAIRNLSTLLDIYVTIRNLGYVGQEKMLIALTRNDYEPDMVYFSIEKSQYFQPEQVKFPAPDLVVEVLSPSTAHNDRGIKLTDYATHGVAEYWIIDPAVESVEQYVLTDSGHPLKQSYELCMKSQTGQLQSVSVPGFVIPVRAIFDEDIKLTTVQALLA